LKYQQGVRRGKKDSETKLSINNQKLKDEFNKVKHLSTDKIKDILKKGGF
jgi:hypothetical protein